MAEPPKMLLNEITLAGFKSIEHMSLDLRQMNVLIGANGAGKTNLISFFNLLRELVEGRLQLFVGKSGGADSLLHYGAETTPCIDATLEFHAGPATLNYRIRLAYATGGALVFNEETVELVFRDPHEPPITHRLGSGHEESRLHSDDLLVGAMRQMLRDCRAYQFHNTSETSAIRQSVYIHDNRVLRPDGGNLAAVLHVLKVRRPQEYWRILQTIRQTAPWFGDFVLGPLELNPEMVRLDWTERGSEKVFGAHQLSDGTLRLAALVTLLLQPEEDLPDLLLIDEPELGLHPAGIAVLAALASHAAHYRQVLIATQSPVLVDEFEPDDLIVVQREEGASVFARQSPEYLSDWLEDYSLGELWQKNVIAGGPF